LLQTVTPHPLQRLRRRSDLSLWRGKGLRGPRHSVQGFGGYPRLSVLLRQNYAGHATAAAKALQAAGARHIYLAGRAGEQEAALRAAGVNDFIFAGGDALAMLREAYRLME